MHVQGARFHIWEQGSGLPAVVFESGIAASSLSWTRVQPSLATAFTTVSYDRAGLGWSSLPPSPLTLKLLTSHLEALLASSCVRPPYVLVGHSFGGILIRAFASAHPEKVAGLVMVDPVSLDSWANASPASLRRLQRGAYFSRRGALLARFGVVRFALAMAGLRRRRLTNAIARVTAGQASSTLSRLVGEIRKLPPSALRVARAEWSLAKCFESMARHLESLPSSATAANGMPLPAGTPLVILSAATSTEAERRERENWTRSVFQARHRVVPETGHWLHLERPDAVIDAVHEVLALGSSQ